MKPSTNLLPTACFLMAISGSGCGGSGKADQDADDAQAEDTGGDDVSADDLVTDDLAPDDPVSDEDAEDPSIDDAAAEDRIEDPVEDPEQDDAEAPTREFWSKTYGGWDWDRINSIQPTSDGGYMVGGSTQSFGAGSADAWIFKLDAFGEIEWEKTYGGENAESAETILETPDGGYFASGYTSSFDEEGDSAAWALKLTADGSVEWQKRYEGGNVRTSTLAHEGGYVLAGHTRAFGEGETDIWILSIDESGNSRWQNTYGGPDYDFVGNILQTPDGGYLLTGDSRSFGTDSDALMMKLDGSGHVVWSRIYAASGNNSFGSAERTSDNGFIAAGSLNSDMWICKTDSNGAIAWQHTYGGSENDYATSVTPTLDGGYITAGGTRSFGVGGNDMWIIRLDPDGLSVWQKTIGSPYDDGAAAALQTTGGAIVIAGQDTFYGTAYTDYWILKTDENGAIADSCPEGMIGDTSVSASPSSITPVVATLTVSPTTAAAVDTSAVPQASSAQTETQCIR